MIHERVPRSPEPPNKDEDSNEWDNWRGSHPTNRMRQAYISKIEFFDLMRGIKSDRDHATIERREIAQDIDLQTAHLDGEKLWEEFVNITGIEAKQRSKSRAFVALCFMHTEKTPSMFMYPSKMLHCYGCSDNMSFGEAVGAQSFVYISDYSARSQYVNVDSRLCSARDTEIFAERVQGHRKRTERELERGLRMARYAINRPASGS